MGYLELDGGRLHWMSEGDGPAVVFVHGGSTDLRMWDDQVPALVHTHRVIRYDVRGRGQSTPPGAPYSMAGDIVALLDHLGVASAAVIGFSTGGGVALDLAITHPDRTDAVMAIGVLLRPRDAAAETALEELNRALAERDEAQQRGDLATAVRADADVWASAHYGAARDRLMTWYLDNPYPYLTSERHERVSSMTPDALAGIRAPTLVVVGDRDVRLARLSAARLVAEIPGAELTEVAGADHHVNTSAPVGFDAVLRGFVQPRT
jgi:pimeloyl-ACP methyl ester carboxylesterase